MNLDKSDSDFPDAYQLAGFIGGRFGAKAIIDIGCHAPNSLIGLESFKKIGRGNESSIAKLQETLPHENWLTIDLESDDDWSLNLSDVADSIVICAGALQAVKNPKRMLLRLAALARSAFATILVVNQDLFGNDEGSSLERFDVSRAWTLREFGNFLRQCGIEPAFLGRTIIRPGDPQKRAAIAVIDRYQSQIRRQVPEAFRPLAVVQTYNDIDIAPQTIRKLLDDNIEVHARDNWSSDGTFEALSNIAQRNNALTLRRFPEGGQSSHHDLVGLLRWKEEVANQHPGRWIITYDSDEVRWSPWRDVSLRGGLYLVDLLGFNAVDFTVLDFRPLDDQFGPGVDPEQALTHFEFGRRPGHFVQVKAWRHASSGLDLVGSGGHNATFPERRVFPYKFLFKHYPLRSPKQAYKKIFRERMPRYNPETRAKGWHIQYNHFKESDRFVWHPDDLVEFDEKEVREDYMVELISGVGIVRS